MKRTHSADLQRARAEQAEWNFKPLENERSVVQWRALSHEIDREIARADGRPAETPWLENEKQRAPNGPSLEIASWGDFVAEYGGRFGNQERLQRIKFYPLVIDWGQMNTDTDIRIAAKKFEQILRNHSDRPQGKDKPMPLLWSVARYRLRRYYGLTFKNGAGTLLEEIGAIDPKNPGTSGSWSNQIRRAERLIGGMRRRKVDQAQRLAAIASGTFDSPGD